MPMNMYTNLSSSKSIKNINNNYSKSTLDDCSNLKNKGENIMTNETNKYK